MYFDLIGQTMKNQEGISILGRGKFDSIQLTEVQNYFFLIGLN